jgi:hypothetical protein
MFRCPEARAGWLLAVQGMCFLTVHVKPAEDDLGVLVRL